MERAKEIQNERYSGINFMNVNNSKNTIEFRLSNGTLDANVWIQNIKLYGRIIQSAHEISKIKDKLEEGKMITEAEEEKLKMKSMLKKDIEIDQKMEYLMQLLFKEDEREVYYQRYKVNKELCKENGLMDDWQFATMVDLKIREDDYKEIYENTKVSKESIQIFKNPDKEELKYQQLQNDERKEEK